MNIPRLAVSLQYFSLPAKLKAERHQLFKEWLLFVPATKT